MWKLDLAAVAVECALCIPEVKHVARNMSKPERVSANAAYGSHSSPGGFWSEMGEVVLWMAHEG